MNPVDSLLYLTRDCGLPELKKEVQLVDGRKWRVDLCNREFGVVVEYEGLRADGLTRHQMRQGYTKDCEKYNEIALLDFLILRITYDHIQNGLAIEWIKKAFFLKGYLPSIDKDTW